MSESRVVVGSVSAVILRVRVRVRVRARARARLVMVMMKMAMMGQLFLLTCIERAVFNGEAAVVVVVVVGHDDGCEEEASGLASNEERAVLHHIHSTVLPVGQIDAEADAEAEAEVERLKLRYPKWRSCFLSHSTTA